MSVDRSFHELSENIWFVWFKLSNCGERFSGSGGSGRVTGEWSVGQRLVGVMGFQRSKYTINGFYET